MRGTLKIKALGLLFLILSILFGFVLIPRLNNSTRETINIPMLNKTLLPGEPILEKDIRMVEVGKYGQPANVIKTIEELSGRYVAKEIPANRYIYKEDITDKQLKTSTIHKIKNGGVGFKTDLSKCVGGIPRPGDFVKIYVVTRNSSNNTMEAVLYKDLRQVEILDIQNINGQEVDNTAEKASLTSARESTPAFVVVNTLYDKQEELIINGMYNGEIHLALLNPENIDKSLLELDNEKMGSIDVEYEASKTTNQVLNINSGEKPESEVKEDDKPANNSNNSSKESGGNGGFNIQ